MRVIYYKRYSELSTHLFPGSYVEGFYLPDEIVVLLKKQHGTFSGYTISFTDNKEVLDELHSLLNESIPDVNRVTYSNIKGLEYDGTRIKELIHNARLESDLRDKVESGFNALLEEANKSFPDIVFD